MTKIVQLEKTGGPENLKIVDGTVPNPGPGEAKITVRAVGLNRAELTFMAGRYMEPTVTPTRIGYEASGVVDAVGPDVDQSWVGKHVTTVPGYSMTKYGVLGEEAVVPAHNLVENPPNQSDVEAAASWMQYATAWGALIHIAHVKPGDFVIIPAASSSVGLAAIQLTKDAGGTAIAATRTSKKSDELKQLGADVVIATEEEDLPARVKELTDGKGARVIFDPVAGPYLEKLADAASYHAILFQYGVLSGQPTPYPMMQALMKALTFRAYTLHEITSNPESFPEAKKYITQRLAEGRLKPKIAKTFPLADIVKAYQYMAANEHVGKIVVTVP